MPSLPTELYRPIFGFITDQPTIYTLLFVSSIFNSEAECVLYRKISPKGTEIQEKLYQHLQSCERVAKLVLDFHVIIGFEIPISYWSLLSLALRSLINLKSLAMDPLPDCRKAHILDGCLFQLESFSWPFLFEEQLLHFFEDQPQIRRLDLRWRSFRGQLSSNALPQLSILTGNAIVINALLPGRKVTHLRWTFDLVGDEPDLERIGPALNNIRVLKYASAPPLDTIINYLGKLDVLEWNRPRHQEILDNASLLPNLQKIILPHIHEPSSLQEFIKKIFASVPSLRSVDSGSENAAFRWSRGSDIPEPIVRHPGDWMFY